MGMDPLDRQVIGNRLRRMGSTGMGYYDDSGGWVPDTPTPVIAGGDWGTGGSVNISTPATTPGFNWGNLLLSAEQSAAKILGTRLAVPQLQAGTVIQTGPGGTTMYAASAGQAVGLPASISNLSSSLSSVPTSYWLIGAAVLAALFMVKSK